MVRKYIGFSNTQTEVGESFIANCMNIKIYDAYQKGSTQRGSEWK